MKKITLCADDYGQNQSISQAIIALFEKNRLSATSCLTSSLFWPEHAKWLQPFANQVDIGLHFNLTEGKPLSHDMLSAHGFLPLSQLILKAYARRLNREAIEAELISLMGTSTFISCQLFGMFLKVSITNGYAELAVMCAA
jgi:chitin disaccharide deacetylase